MIPIEIARLIGLVLGPATAMLVFILWRNFKKEDKVNWRMPKTAFLIAGLLMTVLVSGFVEYNRAPIVKKISYRMERPKAPGEQTSEPVVQKLRMTEQGSTLSVLGPVYERQLIGALLSLLLLFIFYRKSVKKTEAELIPVASDGANKPLTIDKEATLKALQVQLDTKKLYTNPGLSLEDLSGELGVSRYQLSQLINEELKQNFYELINDKRVEAAIVAMNSGEHKHLTLSALGFEVGFNSKSSFYRAFKKKTGLTPAAFRKQLS